MPPANSDLPPGLTEDARRDFVKLVHQTFGQNRFTQDSPVRADVWLGYWDRLAASGPGIGDGPEPRIDLILTPGEGVAAGRVAVMIERLLEASGPVDQAGRALSRAQIRARGRISYSRTVVQAKVTFAELLQAVMPLTSWWHKEQARESRRPDRSAWHRVPGKPLSATEKLFFPLGQSVGPRFAPFLPAETQAWLAENGLWAPDAMSGADMDRRVLLSINEHIRETNGPYQFYRFAALASLTQRWQRCVLDDLTGEGGTQRRAKPGCTADAMHAGARLSRPETVLTEALKELGRDLGDVLALVDRGTERFGTIIGQDREAAENRSQSYENHRNSYDIYSISVNRESRNTVAFSRRTVKADAAQAVFQIDTRGIQWAVIDSGVDARHPAFCTATTKVKWGEKTRVRATYDFTLIRDLMSLGGFPGLAPELSTPDRKRVQDALPQMAFDPQAFARSEVKGQARKDIIASLSHDGQVVQNCWDMIVRARTRKLERKLAQLLADRELGSPIDWTLLGPLIEISHDNHYRWPRHDHGTHVAGILAGNWLQAGKQANLDPQGITDLTGICPGLVFYDLRAFDAYGQGSEDTLIYAFEFVRHLNRTSTQPMIHGVNLSLAVAHDVQSFACGQTPVCVACNELVHSGVVVVAAAGNQGYEGNPAMASFGQNARDISITDPGNAELVITVGATHRFKPHIYGVSYFSSRGPTADGRMKPDLVAPGEKILGPVPMGQAEPGSGARSLTLATKLMDGTSMAAPHVSGIAALLLARHRELIGRPDRVKEILCSTATSLGRLPAFQGAGLVDALRALQSV